MSYYGQWPSYVSVAERRAKAARKVAQLKKQGRSISPVTIKGRTIARSFWGKSWCSNLESYADYDSRLPRGRSYVMHGSVVDLQIAKGKITALVSGSELYRVAITIAPLTAKTWKSICADSAGSIDSLMELLQGKFSKAVMDRVCRKGNGLFPAPKDITLSCDCPDWADMCKHVAATLYGVGARLDDTPDLLFNLRDVDASELLAQAGQGLDMTKTMPAADKVLADDDVAALFGLDMDEDEEGTPKKQPRGKASKSRKAPIARKSGTGNTVAKKSTAKRKTTPKKSAAKKATTKKSVAKKAVIKKSATPKTAAKTAPSKTSITSKTSKTSRTKTSKTKTPALKKQGIPRVASAPSSAKKSKTKKSPARKVTAKYGAKNTARKTAVTKKQITKKALARQAEIKRLVAKMAAARKKAAKK